MLLKHALDTNVYTLIFSLLTVKYLTNVVFPNHCDNNSDETNLSLCVNSFVF